MVKIFIDGQEGTTGLKLLEKLNGRDDLEILKIADEDRKDSEARAEYINASDLTFLCLPDVAAIEAVKLVRNENTRIIDASTAHRVADGWLYGLPELYPNAEILFKNAKRVAVPGCHAGGFISIVRPLVEAGIIRKNHSTCCTSLTGYSGGGKKMIADYENPNRDIIFEAPRPYGLNQNHKHLKEMQYICGLSKAPIFQPIVFDFFSGMTVSVPLDLTEFGIKKSEIVEIFEQKYRNQPLIKVYADSGESVNNGFINSNLFYNRDDMEISINGNDERIIITAVFDNLGKGASGSAVECMNLMFGQTKDYGLTVGNKSCLNG